MELFDRFKRFYRGQQKPQGLFLKPSKEGFLYQLGLWLYQRYMLMDDYREKLKGEYLAWYAEDFISFLIAHGISEDASRISKLRDILKSICDLYSEDEEAYWGLIESHRCRRTIQDHLGKLVASNRKALEKVGPLYAANYADRVFHDRELCDFIANLIVTVGFDGTTGDEEPTKWIRRPRLPERLKRAVLARDRGKCALCGTDIAIELKACLNFDHIVPLSKVDATIW